MGGSEPRLQHDRIPDQRFGAADGFNIDTPALFLEKIIEAAGGDGLAGVDAAVA